jgi:hypothetical protein
MSLQHSTYRNELRLVCHLRLMPVAIVCKTQTPTAVAKRRQKKIKKIDYHKKAKSSFDTKHNYFSFDVAWYLWQWWCIDQQSQCHIPLQHRKQHQTHIKHQQLKSTLYAYHIEASHNDERAIPHTRLTRATLYPGCGAAAAYIVVCFHIY